MIADQTPSGPLGFLGVDIQPKGASRLGIIDFIARHLPLWRDDEKRPIEISEDGLSDQLCRYMNQAARKAPGYDRYQFNREARDEVRRDRNLDIEVSPSSDEIYVEGRMHTLYETVLAIECKRLPTPPGKNRDEREYVITAEKTTGGIQRFRRGDHGSNQSVVGMIGYIHEGSYPDWIKNINGWITALASESGELQWTESDQLVEQGDPTIEPYRAKSIHGRLKELGDILIYHIWIQMNCPIHSAEMA